VIADHTITIACRIACGSESPAHMLEVVKAAVADVPGVTTVHGSVKPIETNRLPSPQRIA
jgi:hypothetical protein